MSKKPQSRRTGGALATTGEDPGKYAIAGTKIEALEIYRVPSVHPSGSGPWADEADKVSWLDAPTGLPCIMRRGEDGALSGFVGVGPSHPLFGFGEDALPHDPPIEVHGGIDYAEPCDEEGQPEVSVCHVHDRRGVWARDPATATAVAALPAQLWWFGFSCNHSYDLVPGSHHREVLSTENGRVYRNETYVAREITGMAAQLHAIAEGRDPSSSIRGDRPARGLDAYDPRNPS